MRLAGAAHFCSAPAGAAHSCSAPAGAAHSSAGRCAGSIAATATGSIGAAAIASAGFTSWRAGCCEPGQPHNQKAWAWANAAWAHTSMDYPSMGPEGIDEHHIQAATQRRCRRQGPAWIVAGDLPLPSKEC